MLPHNHPLPASNIKWVSKLLAALPLPPNQPQPPAITLQTSNTFLARLPAEIRLQIYHYLLDDSTLEVECVPLGLKFKDNDMMRLAQTSRQCRYEAIPLIWQHTTIQVDDSALLALRGVRGLFDPHYIQRASLCDTSLHGHSDMVPPGYRRRPTAISVDLISRQKITVVHTVAHCLERFPNLKYLKLRPQARAKLEVTHTMPTRTLYGHAWDRQEYMQEVLQRARAGKQIFPRGLKGNDWLHILSRKLCRVVGYREALAVDLEVPLSVKLIDPTPGGLPFAFMEDECGDLVVDLANKQIRWKYEGEEYGIDEFEVDDREDYAGGRRYSNVFIS